MKKYVLKRLNEILKYFFAYNIIHRRLTLDNDYEVWNILKLNGFYPYQIFDIGAARGKWTNKMLQIFPNSHFLMVDPLKENESALQRVTNEHPNVTYWSGALGNKDGEMEIHVHSDQTSKFASEWGGELRTIPVRKLDSFISEPFKLNTLAMKIDVQGAELEVLEGASDILMNCKVIQVEVSFRKVYQNAPVAHEIINYFSKKGYRIFDMASAIKRNNDRALLQADMFFVSDENLFVPETWNE